MEHTVIKKWIISSLLILSITSCLSSSVEDLMGPDEDKNGIRDDVDIFIKRQDVKEEYRDAMRQYAFYARESFRYIHNRDESIRNSRQKFLALDCLNALYNEKIENFKGTNPSKEKLVNHMKKQFKLGRIIRKKLHEQIYNSWSRKNAEGAISQNLGGQIYTTEKSAKIACYFRRK